MLSIFRSFLTNPVTAYLGGRKHCDLQLFGRMMPGLIIGAPIGYYVLQLVPASGLRTCVGALCYFVVAERLLKMLRRPRSAAPSKATSSAGLEPAAPSAAVPAEEMTATRSIAAVATGFACGFLGGSLGTSGVPIMIFVSYFPNMHKTTVRTLVSLVGIPSQAVAIVGFVATGVLEPSRDWPSLLCVTALASVGVYAGNALHKRIEADTVMVLLLCCLTVSSIELISESIPIRIVCLLLLGALCVPRLVAAARERSPSFARAFPAFSHPRQWSAVDL